MHKIIGANGSWEIQSGKIGVHPARRDGVLVKNRVRLVGIMPPDSGWAVGDRGMIAPMAGKSPGQGMLYLYPEEHLDQWVKDKKWRHRGDCCLFKVEANGRWGIHESTAHPVIKAVRRAVKWQHFGLSSTEYHVNVNGDSITIRVPNRSDLQPYKSKASSKSNQLKML